MPLATTWKESDDVTLVTYRHFTIGIWFSVRTQVRSWMRQCWSVTKFVFIRWSNLRHTVHWDVNRRVWWEYEDVTVTMLWRLELRTQVWTVIRLALDWSLSAGAGRYCTLYTPLYTLHCTDTSLAGTMLPQLLSARATELELGLTSPQLSQLPAAAANALTLQLLVQTGVMCPTLRWWWYCDTWSEDCKYYHQHLSHDDE